jgi:hypothetical protein
MGLVPRQTHTYALMEVSQATYDEIADLFRKAGYDHVFMENGVIDMQGIGLSIKKDEADAQAPVETSG